MLFSNNLLLGFRVLVCLRIKVFQHVHGLWFKGQRFLDFLRFKVFGCMVSIKLQTFMLEVQK
jgi:hypothetical protein